MKKAMILCCVVFLVLPGCAAFKQQETAQPGQEALNQVFYSFPDIPVPKELEYVRDKSFVYETQTIKAGVIVLNGNVDMQSLENYFKVNMAKNGWKLVNTFRYKDVVMNYTKEDKTCTIKMSRGSFNTDVEIWVGPTAVSTPREGVLKGNERR